VSTTISPVTHTALTDVNRESRKDNGIVCAFGSNSSPEPTKMTIKKLAEKRRAGGIFIELINFAKPGISEIVMVRIAITIGIFP
jgi:hypothetical protein